MSGDSSINGNHHHQVQENQNKNTLLSSVENGKSLNFIERAVLATTDAPNELSHQHDVSFSRSYRDVRKGILFALCCPISGVTMGYTVEFGYDRSLQAALSAASNLISLLALWAVLVWA